MKNLPSALFIKRALWGLGMILLTSTTYAKAESPERLAQIATQSLKKSLAVYEGLSDVKITVEPPSQAERLEACQKTIQIKSQPLSPRLMRVSLQLICPQPRWTIALSAEVSALQQSYRARRLIAKGEAIQAIDFLTQNLPAHQVPRHAITSLKHFDDAIAARDITPNSLLTQRHIDYPILVERNDKVTLVFTNEKIQIKTQGIALRAAKKNEKIQVRNINSNKIITGYVRARGLVEVP